MNWDYIAGFFDGEGTLVGRRRGFRIGITQTNKKVLEEIKNFSKIGHICKITKRKFHWKDSWVYFIAKQSDVYVFLEKIKPKLIVKKKLVDKAIKILKVYLETEKRKKLNLKIRIKEAKNLRGKGLSYREIGKKLSIDFGYARRLIKFH